MSDSNPQQLLIRSLDQIDNQLMRHADRLGALDVDTAAQQSAIDDARRASSELREQLQEVRTAQGEAHDAFADLQRRVQSIEDAATAEAKATEAEESARKSARNAWLQPIVAHWPAALWAILCAAAAAAAAYFGWG